MKLRELPHPTGSKIHRVWKCPASLVLPQHTNEDLEAKWEPARGKGKAIHRYLERVKAVGVAQALGEVPRDLLLLCKALDIDKLPTHLATEVAYAYNWRLGTARELGRSLGHRDYDSLGVDWSCEIPGMYDVVGWAMVQVSPGVLVKRAYVGDYKTGHTRYPRPGVYGQTLLGVLCATLVMGCADGFVEMIYIDDDGDSFPSRDLVDEWDLQTFAREIQETMEAMPELDATFVDHGGDALVKHEGPHCDHCPAFTSCNAKVALIRSVPGELLALGVSKDDKGKLEINPQAITVRNAAHVWEACERIEAICKRMRREVSGIAWNDPVTLSDGRVIERYKYTRRSVDGRTAALVLERHYGRDEAMKAINVKVSIEAIRERVVANIDPSVKPRRPIESKKGDGLLDVVLAEIQAIPGGMTVSVGEECKPHQPRKKPLGSGSR